MNVSELKEKSIRQMTGEEFLSLIGRTLLHVKLKSVVGLSTNVIAYLSSVKKLFFHFMRLEN
jgi:hypothetical protein